MRESLDHALADKAEKMAAVRGFEKRVLVLLNVYFFGDDPEAASVMLAELAPSYGVFDRVYLLEARRGLGLIYAKRSSTTE